jgi:hypothetical protein
MALIKIVENKERGVESKNFPQWVACLSTSKECGLIGNKSVCKQIHSA